MLFFAIAVLLWWILAGLTIAWSRPQPQAQQQRRDVPAGWATVCVTIAAAMTTLLTGGLLNDQLTYGAALPAVLTVAVLTAPAAHVLLGRRGRTFARPFAAETETAQPAPVPQPRNPFAGYTVRTAPQPTAGRGVRSARVRRIMEGG